MNDSPTLRPVLDSRRDAVLDVVFVHGLADNSHDAWAANGFFWLDSLAQDLPSVQLWTLGYSAPRFWFSRQGMSLPERASNILQFLVDNKLGKRPLLFVCHSLGGLVVKVLLRQSHTGGVNDLKPLATNTQGVVFIATPNAGAVLADVAKAFGFAGEATKDLSEHNFWLLEAANWYRNNADELGYATRAFAETQPYGMPPYGLPSFMVVSRSSADPGASGTVCQPIDANHITISKPSSRDAAVYVGVKAFIEKALATSVENSQKPQPRDTSVAGLNRSSTVQAQATRHKIFIIYRSDRDPDERLAKYFSQSLIEKGNVVFLNSGTAEGNSATIDTGLNLPEISIVILSQQAIVSELILQLITNASNREKQAGLRRIIPIRLESGIKLPYDLEARFSRVNYIAWHGDGTEHQTLSNLERALNGAQRVDEAVEDQEFSGVASFQNTTISPPLPMFESRWLTELSPPGGAVRRDSPFYIERNSDGRMKALIRQKEGVTLCLRAGHQMGKTSLLARLHQFTKECDMRPVYLQLQWLDDGDFRDAATFLKCVADLLADQFETTESPGKYWREELPTKKKFTKFITNEVLGTSSSSVVFIFDEVDRLFGTAAANDFFSLLRAWHESRTYDNAWDSVNIVLAYSDESVALITDPLQSPFNVATLFQLPDFTDQHVKMLNRLHGDPLKTLQELEQLMELVSGQPYLIRKALYEMATESITLADFIIAATGHKGPFEDHLAARLLKFQDDAQLRLGMKSVLQTNSCPTDRIFYQLLAAGLIKGKDRKNVVPRCALYNSYFSRHL